MDPKTPVLRPEAVDLTQSSQGADFKVVQRPVTTIIKLKENYQNKFLVPGLSLGKAAAYRILLSFSHSQTFHLQNRGKRQL